jgi:hypothetical protein
MAQQRAQAVHHVRQLGAELLGAARQHVAGRGAHEQLVLEEAAQAAERAAHRGLAEPDATGGDGDVALVQERVERDQEVEVDGGEVDRAMRGAARALIREGARAGLEHAERGG